MLKPIWPLCVLYALCVFAVLAKTEHNTSELCYLADGSSSQTFLVNEASPVNTVLGNIQVIGRILNTSEPAEIKLTIERVELSGPIHSDETVLLVSPVRIENGSKQLILNRSLDKEAPEGESGITVHIKCNRLPLESDQQPINIPIRIIVTDANDHTPVFINTPYIANVSELAPLYSQILPAGAIRAIDNDQEGPFSTVQYSVLPGPYNHMVRFQSPLGGALLLNSQLDYETLPQFWIEICASDQGEPPRQTTTKLIVNVIDADDQNPRFLDEKYTCYWDDTYKIGDTVLISPRQIKAIDSDANINAPIEYQFNTLASGEQPIFNLDSKKGILTVAKLLNSDIQLPRTYVLKAVQTDNPDRYALTTLTVYKRKNSDGSFSSSNDKLHFIVSSYTTSILENSPAGQAILNIQVQPSSNSAYQSIKYQILDDDQSHFTIKENGQILLNKPLDFENKKFHLLRVLATDGTQSDICRINITVLNVNDHNPSFAQPYYNFFVSESKLHQSAIVGQLKVTDEDSMDEIKLSLKGPFSNWFTISDDGILRIRTLNNINSTQCHLVVQASDTGSPPRTSSVPVTVQLPTTILTTNNFIQSSSGTIDFGRFDINKQELNEANGLQETTLLDVNSIISSNGSSSALILVIVLGVLLATLFIIIITLTVHVLKQRRFSSDAVCSASAGSGCSQRSESHSPDIQLSFQHQLFAGTTSFDTHLLPTNDQSGTIRRISCSSTSNRLNSLIPGLDNPVFNSKVTNVPNIISNNNKILRNESDSAIVSDVSSNEGRSVTGTIINQTIRSPPPPPSSILATNTNSLIWSQQNGSIPRRVKKLTWEDEKFGGFGSTSIICSGTERLLNSSSGYELDPDVSVTPIRKTMLHQHNDKTTLPDCTVYF